MVDMEPGEVGRISQELKALGDTANAEIGKLFGTSGTAAAGNQGWQAADGLTGCVTSWRNELAAIVEDIKSNATYVATSASLVDKFDKEGERRFRAVLNELANL